MSETSNVDNAERSSHEDIPVVGIGASAGGVTALSALLPLLKAGHGIAYVIVQHLDPHHESKLSVLLGRAGTLPVLEAADGMPVEPDHVYVIPPNVTLTIVDGHLALGPAQIQLSGQRMPIDLFFRSLAGVKGESAACVILTGTGSDGTIGLRAIKEHGGLTVAQDGAEYDGMMRSAVATGLVDVVLALEHIPAKLVDYFQHLSAVGARKGADGVRPEATDQLAQIAALLRARTGHDFSGYKDKTVARRIQRRMQVLQIDEVEGYIDRLRKEPEELDALLQDLLIGVTSFFRDAEAFKALEEQVIPQLFRGKGAQDAVRVWIPGCSTGEEAYSIAILLREHLSGLRDKPRLQVFASDIDEHALQMARLGRFSATAAHDIPKKLLKRYFTQEDGSYRITSELREICIFSSHNLLRDAPFSKLDLISCRNLLIYLTPDLQNRLIPLFHYALNDDGFLFLGSSENVTRHTRLFPTIDKAHRIFRRRPQVERRLPEFPLTSSDAKLRRLSPPGKTVPEHEPLQAVAERQLLDRYAPPFVVINAEGEVLHGSARTGKYLELAPGVPRIDIFSMARQGLRPDLRAAIHKAISSGEVAVQRNVMVGTNGGRQQIDLIVHPIKSAALQDNLYMVVFQDVGGTKPTAEPEPAEAHDDLENANLRQLEMELRATRERLQTTTEELESSNEELKSSNEELSSMNEELQSANEELETSKEELQSINEELQTVNAELNARVEELSRANSDIANLLESTQIATIFLDRDLGVKSFTPAAKDIFRLVESDTGRPITHVRARFDSDTIQDDAERVLRTLTTIERQIESNHDNSRYIMRMMPYRTVENVIAGVVITFVDITRLSAAEVRINELSAALRHRVQALETLLDLLPVGIMMLEDHGSNDTRINRYGAALLGLKTSDVLEVMRSPSSLRLFQDDKEIEPAADPLQRAAHEGQSTDGFEGQVLRPDGSRVDVLILAAPLVDDHGRVSGGIAVMVDISERKRADAQQTMLLYELQHRVKNTLGTISALATRMLRTPQSTKDFSAAFLGRLQAMAMSHDLLSRGNWGGADLRQLIAATTQAHVPDTESMKLEGPAVTLAPNTAATIGLVFYELVTNAVKYGALRAAKGRIDVSWQLAGGGEKEVLQLSWRESNGTRATVVEGGFGTNFIQRSIEYELQGSATVQPEDGGLRWTIEFPVAGNVQSA
jgi:two-component system CheB/CheR fusion protein